MNNILYNQLSQVKATKIEFDENTTKHFIPKTIRIQNAALQVGHIYDIKLKPSIINPIDSTLADNWNQGRVPEYSSYTVEVESNIGNMIKINGVAIENHSSHFIGYIPSDSFEVIKIY